MSDSRWVNMISLHVQCPTLNNTLQGLMKLCALMLSLMQKMNDRCILMFAQCSIAQQNGTVRIEFQAKTLGKTLVHFIRVLSCQDNKTVLKYSLSLEWNSRL